MMSFKNSPIACSFDCHLAFNYLFKVFPMSDRKLHPRRQPDFLHWQLRARPEQPARPAVRALRQEAPHQRHLPGLRQQVPIGQHLSISTCNIYTRAANDPSAMFSQSRRRPTRAFSWLKLPTSAFTFKTLCQMGINPR